MFTGDINETYSLYELVVKKLNISVDGIWKLAAKNLEHRVKSMFLMATAGVSIINPLSARAMFSAKFLVPPNYKKTVSFNGPVVQMSPSVDDDVFAAPAGEKIDDGKFNYHYSVIIRGSVKDNTILYARADHSDRSNFVEILAWLAVVGARNNATGVLGTYSRSSRRYYN